MDKVPTEEIKSAVDSFTKRVRKVEQADGT